MTSRVAAVRDLAIALAALFFCLSYGWTLIEKGYLEKLTLFQRAQAAETNLAACKAATPK